MAELETLMERKEIGRAIELSNVVIPLLKGVIYKENDEHLWHGMLRLQATLRDYVSTMGLELVLDEAEGYAFLRSKREDMEEEQESQAPRLIPRRQLSFPVSLILALLRRRLAEFDQRGGDTRLVLYRDEIVQMVRVFFPDGTNDVKLISQVDTHLNKIIELGFLRKLKGPADGDNIYEVRRILKAFVDAQWLSDFDTRLAQYQKHLEDIAGVTDDDE